MRRKRETRNVPFRVERMGGATLVEQVVGGLRQAILSGFYRPGDVLPSITALAETLGVSRIVTRHAVRTLAEERYIHSRPSAGSIVLDSEERRWKGRVLLVRRTNGFGYYDSVFEAVLRSRLVKEGWLCTSVCAQIGTNRKSSDVEEVKAAASRPFDLAVVLFDNPAAEEVLSGVGTPFVVLGIDRPCRLRGCKASINFDRTAAGGQFVAACRSAGIKHVVQVGMYDHGDVSIALRRAGIRLDTWLLRGVPKDASLDAYVEAGRGALSDFIKSKRPLPDAFYFIDDYVCAGALSALSDAGIRAPADVRVATWANHGNVPAYARPLSRIELNPQGNAEDIASFCIGLVSGKGYMTPPSIEPTWIQGETL